jgi:hypothetical protein
MGWLRRLLAQRAAAVVLLLAVLAAPLARSIHHHDANASGPSRDACAVCAATLHAPALLAPAALLLVLVSIGSAPAAMALPAPRDAQRRMHSTRGPPSLLHTLVA